MEQSSTDVKHGEEAVPKEDSVTKSVSDNASLAERSSADPVEDDEFGPWRDNFEQGPKESASVNASERTEEHKTPPTKKLNPCKRHSRSRPPLRRKRKLPHHPFPLGENEHQTYQRGLTSAPSLNRRIPSPLQPHNSKTALPMSSETLTPQSPISKPSPLCLLLPTTKQNNAAFSS
jgi:hypothetical protein